MCDARLFAPQIAAFSADRAVLVPPLTGANTIAGMAYSVLQCAPPQFALAGLSMGGKLAQGRHLWQSIWLFNANGPGLPYSGYKEIDIIEALTGSVAHSPYECDSPDYYCQARTKDPLINSRKIAITID